MDIGIKNIHIDQYNRTEKLKLTHILSTNLEQRSQGYKIRQKYTVWKGLSLQNDVGKTGQSHARMILDPIFFAMNKNQLKMKEKLE